MAVLIDNLLVDIDAVINSNPMRELQSACKLLGNIVIVQCRFQYELTEQVHVMNALIQPFREVNCKYCVTFTVKRLDLNQRCYIFVSNY